MIKVENIETWGFKHAIRGMRNPMNSWDKSDSVLCPGAKFDDCVVDTEKCPRKDDNFDYDIFCIGKNDLDLMRRLYQAGTEHRKYLRQIFVSFDITAPLYWWKEFDTYKVGTVSNSCSTMHKIAEKEFTWEDFSTEHLIGIGDLYNPETVSKHSPLVLFQEIIGALNYYRKLYLETKDKDYWWQMIQILPSSYNQRRTITMNYENVMNIIHQRENHKLDEWRELVGIFKGLPYIEEIMQSKPLVIKY